MSIVRLARDLGLSISTVSRALNGYTDVAEATRQRVAARAAEIGYRANPGARRLKTGKTSAIGVVLPGASSEGHLVDPIYSDLLGGVAAEIESFGSNILATMLKKPDLQREVSLYENLIRGSWVDALLIVRTRQRDPRVELAQKAGIPFVTYGRTTCPAPYTWVDTDNEQAFHLGVARLLDQGHRRIALLNGPAEFNFVRLRQKGYERAFEERGLGAPAGLALHGDLTESSGYQLCRELLRQRRPPTALICATDAMAIGALAACREAGRKVGHDISLIGYGNAEAGRFTDPPLTTIEHHVYDNGRHIGLALLKLLGGAAPGQFYMEPVTLVPRHSDGPAPV